MVSLLSGRVITSNADENSDSRPRNGRLPKALVHKKILNTARANPDAPIRELADQVDRASTKLVGNVPNEYGDPAEGSNESDSIDQDTSTGSTPVQTRRRTSRRQTHSLRPETGRIRQPGLQRAVTWTLLWKRKVTNRLTPQIPPPGCQQKATIDSLRANTFGAHSPYIQTAEDPSGSPRSITRDS